MHSIFAYFNLLSNFFSIYKIFFFSINLERKYSSFSRCWFHHFFYSITRWCSFKWTSTSSTSSKKSWWCWFFQFISHFTFCCSSITVKIYIFSVAVLRNFATHMKYRFGNWFVQKWFVVKNVEVDLLRRICMNDISVISILRNILLILFNKRKKLLSRGIYLNLFLFVKFGEGFYIFIERNEEIFGEFSSVK